MVSAKRFPQGFCGVDRVGFGQAVENLGNKKLDKFPIMKFC